MFLYLHTYSIVAVAQRRCEDRAVLGRDSSTGEISDWKIQVTAAYGQVKPLIQTIVPKAS
jgi:hypothetical protein